MPLSFPSHDHIPLRNPPLREVICQVKFPPILKIAEGVDAGFQDAIRGRFPALGMGQGIQVALVPGRPSAEVPPPTHRFLDKNEDRTVSLGVDFFALSVTKYDGWEAFAEDLGLVAQAAISIYQLPYATRIGLRYINMLDTSNTKTDDFFPGVLDMLRPELTTLLRVEEMWNPDLSLTHIRIKHEESMFTFRSGIVEDEGQRKFVLDFDLFTEKEMDLGIESLLVRCERYHALIYNAFRWCIMPDRLSVFCPVK